MNSTPLTEEEKGAISYALLKEIISRQGLKSFEKNRIKREIGDIAQKFKIDPEKVRQVLKQIGDELFDEAFDFNFSPKK